MSSDQENRNVLKSKAVNNQDINAEHKLFLQAFEKPTQIYRFLRNRHLLSPIFLHRTLSYMQHRMSRGHKGREGFKVDSILERVMRTRTNACENKFSNLVIVGLGVFDEKLDSKLPAKLEVSLVKFCHKKRKDQITPVSSVPIGNCELSVNSNDQPHLPVVLAVPKQYFNLMNGHLVKHYSLQFKVTASHSQTCNSEIKSDVINGDDSELPSLKKRKVTYQAEYQRELTVIDQNHQCVLIDGKYQLVLEETTKDSTNCPLPAQQFYNNQTSSWEPLQRDKSNDSLIFGEGPLLVFHLFWTDSELESFTCPGRLNPRNPTALDCNNENNRLLHVDGITTSSPNLLLQSNGFISTKAASPCESSSLISSSTSAIKPAKPSLSSRLTYRFLYNNVVIQHTRSSQDLKCPWCSLKCKIIISLMTHLKNCHPRFNFLLLSDVKGHKIDITLNDNFDGSYSGNPHDLAQPTTGHAFSNKGPVRRSTVTQLIYLQPKAPRYPQFIRIDDPDGSISIRPYVSGHNRQYYQSTDCFPIRPQMIDEDSEAEIDPEWMKVKTQLMIDEFTDVNEGEKEVMKLWNLHGMKHGFVGDCQIPLACDKFVDQYWKELFNRNLYKNFILHLNNLFDFGVLPAASMRSIIRRLNQYRNQCIKKQESR